MRRPWFDVLTQWRPTTGDRSGATNPRPERPGAPPRIRSRRLLPLSLAAAALTVAGCRADVKPPPLGSPAETMSDVDHGAAAAAVDAMESLAGDAQPDTELHLQLSPARPATSDDSTRADVLLVALRTALAKYSDIRVAAANGFEEMPGATGTHAIHHLSNWSWAHAEARRFDPTRPTSLLYREDADDALKLVGAMYTAPASATPDELDKRIPVSFARWHQHVNWCTPKTSSGDQWIATQDGSPIYGPRSPIASRDACDAAGGVFYPRVYGWMVHVIIVGSDDPAVVWGGAILPPPADSSTTPHDTTAHQVGTRVVARPVAAPPRVVKPPPVPPVVPPAAPSPTAVARPPVTLPAVVPATAPISGTFRSAFAQVAYDRYVPTNRGRHPAILLLHDGNGPTPQATLFQNLSTTLVQRGYVVEVVHYFDRTGTVIADGNARRKQYRQWAAAVRDALNDLADAPGVDGDKLGILGTGLGATLALTVGAQEPRVKAVIDYSGSIPAQAAPLIQRMPAVLIAHGDQDKAVPVMEAYRIRAICQAVKAPVELDIFTGQAHGFRGPDAQTVHQRTFAFLDRYLKTAN